MTTAAKPYHHGNLRESLLLAAEDLLAQRGEAALGLREVAKAAGVSHAAPYHHFAGRDELLAAVAERAFVGLADAMEVAARVPDPHERLLCICEAYVEFAQSRPAPFRLMFGPVLAKKHEHPDLRQAAERAFRVLVQAAVEYSPAEGAALALTGWSLAHGLANLLIDGAFDGLPISVPEASVLARSMAYKLLGAPR